MNSCPPDHDRLLSLLSPEELFGPLRPFGLKGWPSLPILLHPELRAAPDIYDIEGYPVAPLESTLPAQAIWETIAQLCAQIPGGSRPDRMPVGYWRAVPDACSWLNAWGAAPESHKLAEVLMRFTTQQAWLRFDGAPYVFAVGEDESSSDHEDEYEETDNDRPSRQKREAARLSSERAYQQDVRSLSHLWKKVHPRDVILMAVWVGMLGSCSSGMMKRPEKSDWWSSIDFGPNASMFSVNRVEVAKIWATWIDPSRYRAFPFSNDEPDAPNDWLTAAAWVGASLVSPPARCYIKASPRLTSNGFLIDGQHVFFDAWEATDLPMPIRLDVLRARSDFLEDQVARGVRGISSLFPSRASEFSARARSIWERALLSQGLSVPENSGDTSQAAHELTEPLVRPRRI